MIQINKHPGYYWDEATGFVFSTKRGGLKSLKWNGTAILKYVTLDGVRYSADAIKILIMRQEDGLE